MRYLYVGTKREIYVPIMGLIVGELIMFYGYVLYGLYIHMINVLIMVLLITFSSSELRTKNILQSIILLTLLRMINLLMPQFFTVTILQYLLVYGTMFIPIYSIIKSQKISSEELGINLSGAYIYVPAAIIIGALMATVEYGIMIPISIVEKVSFSDIVFMTVVMFVFVGTVEEVIFRSIFQTRIEKMFGSRYGILLSGGIFGIMHASYGILNGVLFASMFGIVVAYIFHKTKNVLFVISIRGTADVMLFGIIPYMLARF